MTRPASCNAHTLDIADADGIPISGDSRTFTILDKYTYRWIRVDDGTETNIGTDSSRYRLVDADIGTLIKVEVSFEDHADNAERVTSKLFGPITEPAPLPSPTTLVGNTGQPASATVANITGEYAMGFMLGDHGQGYEIASVSIDLAAAPSDLTVSLWMGKHSGSGQGGSRVKLFDFENPASFQTRLNEFTAPAGAFAYHGVEYFIVLSDFGASLSINETTSNNEDAGGETGATLADSAGGDTNVLRLAVKGSRRDGGILVSNFAQPGEGDQEVISLDDKCCFTMDVGNADRYLIRGFSWTSDDTTSRNGGWRNPFELHEGSSTGVKDGDDTRRLTMYNTRNNEGVAARTAPLGATVAGGSRTYTFLLDVDLGVDGTGTKIERLDAVLIRNIVPAADGEDMPGAAGFDLSGFGDASIPDAPYVTVFGEPLVAMTSNFGQTNNGFHSLGSASTKVASQAFTTGSDEFGYRLQGIGVNIEGSDSDADGIPITATPRFPTARRSCRWPCTAIRTGSRARSCSTSSVPPNTRRATASSRRRRERTWLRAPATCWSGATTAAPGTGCSGPRATARTRAVSQGSGSRTRSTGGPISFDNGRRGHGRGPGQQCVGDRGVRRCQHRGRGVRPQPGGDGVQRRSERERGGQRELHGGARRRADGKRDGRRQPGVTVSSDALSVNEGGNGSYTVVLDAEPTASVTTAAGT